MRTLIFLLFTYFFCHQLSFGQTDKVEEKVDAMLEEKNDNSNINEPTKAALFSAVLPGLGQAYNKKYWKVPLVYGGAVAFGAVIRYNQDQYITFRNELIRQTDGDPSTEPISNFNETSLRSIRDQARRNRDFTIILSILFYGLNIADAAVDAHLKDFDVDDDLSMQVYPTLLPNLDGRAVPSLAFSIKF